MQLTASNKAQFFIQNEYYQVEIKENSVLLSSVGSEEHIPFTIWNGKVSVKRGLLWSSLQFFAHEQDGKQQSWLVQGLPYRSVVSLRSKPCVSIKIGITPNVANSRNIYPSGKMSCINSSIFQPTYLTQKCSLG